MTDLHLSMQYLHTVPVHSDQANSRAFIPPHVGQLEGMLCHCLYDKGMSI